MAVEKQETETESFTQFAFEVRGCDAAPQQFRTRYSALRSLHQHLAEERPERVALAGPKSAGRQGMGPGGEARGRTELLC